LILAEYIFIVLSRVGVTYKTGFRLDDWIYYTLYIHTTRDCWQHNAIADLHNLKFTVTHALGFSVFISRIQATDLELSHYHFKSHMKTSLHRLIPFRALILRLPILKTQLHSIPLFQAHNSAGRCFKARPFTSNSTTIVYFYYLVTSSVSFYNPSARTTQNTQPLLLTRNVYRPVA
jgi:hypothetical protein